jgi:hypothetical protein
MRKSARGLVGLGIALIIASIVAIALTHEGHDAHPIHRAAAHVPLASAISQARSSRPAAAGWATIKQVANLRRMALAPRRTAQYRAFAAYMGLSGLVSLKPILPGRCANAVRYLYNNLLDLLHAYTGEDWMPLRRAIATQPSLSSCVPRSAPQYVG